MKPTERSTLLPASQGILNQRLAGYRRSLEFEQGRRRFMVGAAGLTFGVIAGVPELMKTGTAFAAAARKQTVVNAWVTISTDGTVFIMSPATEMGQGSLTSIPVILADAMDADWTRVKLVAAPPNDKVYGNPRFANAMYTAGSA